MKALISTVEPRETGYRVAEVVADENIFPVSPELFWTACPDDLLADQKWYDPVDQQFKDFPPPLTPDPASQPQTSGTQQV